ncbi:MAG: hypothetical protein R8K49_01635 [Mariprofundaceae bacterium]
MAKSGLTGIKVTEETKSQLSIIAGQGRTDQDSVIENAIRLLYEMLPESKAGRVSLVKLVDEQITAYQEKQQSKDQAAS